jgi:tetratricopeptide (TPR) repeat protein
MAILRHRSIIAFSCLVVMTLLAGCAGVTMFETAESLTRQGRELYLAKKYDEAIGKFEDAIMKDNTYWLAYVYLARCYIAKNDWFKGIFNARKAYQLAPGGEDVVPAFAEALLGGGFAALGNGQFSEAIGNLVEYLRLKPTDARAYLSLGRAYLGSGAYGDALTALLNGLTQGDSGSRQELIQGLLDGGTKALSQGDSKAAIGFLLEYVRRDPSNLSALLNLGKAYWQAGERLESLNMFRRALELNPGNSEALQFLRGLGR